MLGSFIFSILCLHVRCFNPGMIFVALRWTLSTSFLSFSSLVDHTALPNSKWGLQVQQTAAALTRHGDVHVHKNFGLVPGRFSTIPVWPLGRFGMILFGTGCFGTRVGRFGILMGHFTVDPKRSIMECVYTIVLLLEHILSFEKTK